MAVVRRQVPGHGILRIPGAHGGHGRRGDGAGGKAECRRRRRGLHRRHDHELPDQPALDVPGPPRRGGLFLPEVRAVCARGVGSPDRGDDDSPGATVGLVGDLGHRSGDRVQLSSQLPVDLPPAIAVGPRRASPIGRPAFQVLAFIALATAVKVAISLLQEPDAIEAYHWMYAQHPAAGYFDHPGMIGWLIWLSTSVFGDSLLAIRLPTIVGSGLAVWLAFLAGRRMYDEKAGRLAALLVGVVPLTARFAMEA